MGWARLGDARRWIQIGFFLGLVVGSLSGTVFKPELYRLYENVKLGNTFPSCDSYAIKGTVVGTRCEPRWPFSHRSERFDIKPEYQVAFMLEKTAEYRAANKLYPGSEWLFLERSPIQRIPGEAYATYDYIPPDLDPALQRFDPGALPRHYSGDVIKLP